MENHDTQSLQVDFDAAFIFPFAGYRWNSDRARAQWIDLETWQDALAGPISSIVEKGNCAYVYGRDDKYFAGVSDPATLLDRLRRWHDKLNLGTERFIPRTSAEKADLEAMRKFTTGMWALAEKAVEIENLRWARERKSI